MTNDINKKRLEVFLTEYKELRNHINENINHQIKLFTIIISALGVIYGIIFAYDQAHDLILVVPLLILTLGLRFQYEKYGVYVIGKYLETLENNIRNIISFKDWQGYQNVWRKYKDNTPQGIWKGRLYDILPTWSLFIFIPMSISIFYSLFVLIGIFTNHNNLPDFIYLSLIITYLLCIIISPYITHHINKLQSEPNNTLRNKNYQSKILQIPKVARKK